MRKDTTIVRNTNFTATRKEWMLGKLETTPKAVGVTLDVKGWNDPSARITIGLETSLDGETWMPFCAMGATGTPTTNPDGTPSSAYTFIVSNPPAGVFYKGYAKTNGATIRLALSLVELT